MEYIQGMSNSYHIRFMGIAFKRKFNKFWVAVDVGHAAPGNTVRHYQPHGREYLILAGRQDKDLRHVFRTYTHDDMYKLIGQKKENFKTITVDGWPIFYEKLSNEIEKILLWRTLKL